MALVQGIQLGLAQRYWEASLVWKGVKDHPAITNFEELIDELSILRTKQGQVGLLATQMMGDVVEDVRRRPKGEARIYRLSDRKEMRVEVGVVIAQPLISEPKTMVN